jgi:hypothetical protein
MKKIVLFGLLVLVVIFFVGCAAGPNTLAATPPEGGQVAGFWMGLWHGIIAPIALVVSLFNDAVTMYEVHNNGGWYNFGFLLGVTAIWGGSHAARSRGR